MQARSAARFMWLGDAAFLVFLAVYVALSLSLIPYDFTDLCYLFSLEQGRWVIQEWVHPLWVPLLAVLKGTLALFGYRGRMFVPVETFNVGIAAVALSTLYWFARSFGGNPLAAAIAVAATAFAPGFWSGAVRPTPYAAALLCQILSLAQLVSPRPTPRRYAAAGALTGLAMAFHAAGMALGAVALVCAFAEPRRSAAGGGPIRRLLAFTGAMLAVAAVAWTIFIVFRGIDADYFRRQDFYTTFLGIEQTPLTSIYTSQNVQAQATTFSDTLLYQAGVLLKPALVIGLAVAFVVIWRRGNQVTRERRLAVAAAANFAAFGGFFLINGTRNGFIFAALTLLPVVLAAAARNSWIAIAALAVLALPTTQSDVRYALRTNAHGAGDRLLAEVKFLQKSLGPRDVVLTPGSPFAELFYLAHLNVLEISESNATSEDSEVPVVHAGPALRARVAWWIAGGSKVLYALGDESTDFKGDIAGAEKGQQIFWRPEAEGQQRAPRLQAIRRAVESSGLELREAITSPNGERYAQVQLGSENGDAEPPAAAMVAPGELIAIFSGDRGDATALYARRAQFLDRFAAALPGDPWVACDVMRLVCDAQPRRDGRVIKCEPLTGCSLADRNPQMTDQRRENARQECFWGPLSDHSGVHDYLAAWVQKHHLGELSDWGFEAHERRAELLIVVPGGHLRLTWTLQDSCAAADVAIKSQAGISVDATQIGDLLEALPIPKVHPSSRSLRT